jgi:hypothetical protein
MMRSIATAMAAAVLIAGAAPALAAPCKDAKGKFVKCSVKAPAKPVRCKDARNKFAKCGTPGARPA